MKSIYNVIAVVCLTIVFFSCSKPTQKSTDSLYQTSTINALLAGYYEGSVTFGELKKKGDFGIGTFNDLDGEMVAVDGNFYQIKSNGNAYAVADEMKTPFATVTNFNADTVFNLSDTLSFSDLKLFLDSILPTKNIFYAFKIEGEFGRIKTRSVPRQSKPYQPLVKVVSEQPVFEFTEVKGVLVGFRVPEYMSGINVPGFHFHFLSADFSKGGHLLDCKITNVTVGIDSIHTIQLTLPSDPEFYQMPLTITNHKELDIVEK